MSCNSCTKRGSCGSDPSICGDYTMDPEAALICAIQEEMPTKPGVLGVKAVIQGSMLRVALTVHHDMCDSISKDLYTGVIGRIIQRILDESDGTSQVEYADISFNVGD